MVSSWAQLHIMSCIQWKGVKAAPSMEYQLQLHLQQVFSYLLMVALKLSTVSLDCTTLNSVNVQVVPLREIKASRSIRYAGGSSLAQSKCCCHMRVF